MALENIYTDAFIRSVLANDSAFTTALGGAKIYRGRRPQNSDATACFFSLIDAEDVSSGNKQHRLIVRATYDVRVTGRGYPDANRRTAAHRMDVLLGYNRRVSFTIDGVTLSFNSWREAVRPTTEPGATADEFFMSDGGLYTFEAFTAE